MSNPRAIAARVVHDVFVEGRYLDAALAEVLDALPNAAGNTTSLIQELSYGTLRWFHQLDAIATLFLDKPLKPKDQDVYALLLVGLYQLNHMRVAPHAAVNETVEAVSALKKTWAKNMLNACLRGALRDKTRIGAALALNPTATFSHPAWMLERIQSDWPEHWKSIVTANNERPPLVLRINAQHQTREQYLTHLDKAGIGARALEICDTAIQLDEPRDVRTLPGFISGDFSVQDAAAQLAAPLLNAQPGETILDACAAPGGKTGHVLEHTPRLSKVVALDRDGLRLRRTHENLARLGFASVTLLEGDASKPASWWDGQYFDRILVDVPCSATGVIRRHPDIKIRRRPDNLPMLIRTQADILEGLWPLLKRGGKLLYATCSIFPVENEHQVGGFLRRHPDAAEDRLTLSAGQARSIGRQILPGESGLDGFYYARLYKK